MDPFAVKKNLEAIIVGYKNAIKRETSEVVIGMHKTKIKALEQAISDQKRLKYYGGVENLIKQAEKGAETDLFNNVTQS